MIEGSVFDGRMARKYASALFLAALLLGACDSDGAGRTAGFTVDTLDNGTVRISNPATGGWQAGEEWRLRRDLTLGAADGTGPEVFGQIVAVEVDQEGNLYVLDSGSNEVRVFDPAGNFRYAFGRAGAGPGELAQPVTARWGPDGNLWILDFGNRRWSVFQPSGEYVRQVSRPVNSIHQPWPGGFDSAGRILDIVTRTTLGVTDTATTAIDSVTIATRPSEHFEVRTENMRASYTVPFTPQPSWKVDGEGTIWTGDGSTYELVRMTPAGDTLTILRRRYTPQPVTAAEREAAVQQVRDWAERFGAEPDLSRIPSTKTAYSDFFISDDGHVWVVTEAELGEQLITYSRFDVFDPDGRFLGTAVSDTPIFPYVTPIFRGDQVIAVIVDDMHVMYVVRLRIER